MKQIIDKKIYDTEKAELLFEHSYLHRGDFNWYSEDLYVTKNGSFFIAFEGGAASKYANVYHGGSSGNSGIITISRDEAYEKLESWAATEIIERFFKDEIKEG